MTDERRQTLIEAGADVKDIRIASHGTYNRSYLLGIYVNNQLVAISGSITYQRAYQAALLRIGLLDYQALRSKPS